MNDNLQIISKGLYKGAVDKAFPVYVKEYIFTRKSGRKCLLLRFFNPSDLNVTAINFLLIQKNSYGEEIHREKISLEGIYCAAGKVFSPLACFFVQDVCVNFEVEMISAFSGEYEYKSENGEAFVRYPIDSNKKSVAKRKGYCIQRTKLDNKVKFSIAILVLAIFLILVVSFGPFFIKEVLPEIIRVIGLVIEAIGKAIVNFFSMIGNLFD